GAQQRLRLASLRGVWDLSLDPAHDDVGDVAPLAGGEFVAARDLVVALQAAATARCGGVLGDEHGVIAVGRLLALAARVCRRDARGDQIVSVAADGAHHTQLDERALTTAEVEAGPERLLCEHVQLVVDRFDRGGARVAIHASPLTDRATRRCSRIVSIPSAPGWRPKPQYMATPKSLRYLEAVRCLRSSPETPSTGSTMPRNTRAGPGSRSTSGRKKLRSSLRRYRGPARCSQSTVRPELAT